MSDQSLPDPSGHPNPVADAVSFLGNAAATVLAMGACALVVAAIAVPTMGATRSAKLQWQERNRQAEEAIKKAEAAAQQADPAEYFHE